MVDRQIKKLLGVVEEFKALQEKERELDRLCVASIQPCPLCGGKAFFDRDSAGNKRLFVCYNFYRCLRSSKKATVASSNTMYDLYSIAVISYPCTGKIAQREEPAMVI